MLNPKGREFREEELHIGRAVMAIFALIVAAAHLSYVIPSLSMIASITSHSGGQTAPSGPMQPSFNMLGFWFDVEIIAYTLIAIVFLLGLRTWYPLSITFNAFNLGLYLLSGLLAIPGLTQSAFGSHLSISIDLTTNNILIFSWVLAFILGLILLKYDPGSELDRLLVTKRSR